MAFIALYSCKLPVAHLGEMRFTKVSKEKNMNVLVAEFVDVIHINSTTLMLYCWIGDLPTLFLDLTPVLRLIYQHVDLSRSIAYKHI